MLSVWSSPTQHWPGQIAAQSTSKSCPPSPWWFSEGVGTGLTAGNRLQATPALASHVAWRSQCCTGDTSRDVVFAWPKVKNVFFSFPVDCLSLLFSLWSHVKAFYPTSVHLFKWKSEVSWLQLQRSLLTACIISKSVVKSVVSAQAFLTLQRKPGNEWAMLLAEEVR